MVNALTVEAGADAMAAFGPGQVVINLRSGVTVAALPAGPYTAGDTNEGSLGDAGDYDLTKRPERHKTISKISELGDSGIDVLSVARKGAAYSDASSVDEARREYVLQAQDSVLPFRRGQTRLQVVVVRSDQRCVVVRVAEGNRTCRRKIVVDFADHIIFLAVPCRVEQELRGIPCDKSVGEGVERQKGLDARINGDLGGGSASAVCAKNTITGIQRKGRIGGRQALYLLQAFVVCKEKGLVFFDWPAYGAAVLMAAKWRYGRIKKVPGIECAVSV